LLETDRLPANVPSSRYFKNGKNERRGVTSAGAHDSDASICRIGGGELSGSNSQRLLESGEHFK